jgi:hypothetical protein
LFFAMLLAIVPSASATAIPVTNASFETLPGGGLPFSCGTNCAFSVDGVIPGWTTSNTPSGEFQPGPPTNTTYFNSIPDGSVIAYLDAAGTITQSVGAVSAAGQLYTLLVDIGQRKDLAGAFIGTEQLVIGSTVINGTGAAPTAGNWSTFTAMYITTAADIGQTISIQLSSAGVEGDFDNVRLDSSVAPVPEPMTVGLLGFGLLAAGLAKRLI